jgi:threonyl-tRNA synthetase
MPAITLPDGSTRNYDHPLTIMDVAADIGPGLAKATLAGEIDGVLYDAVTMIERDVSLRIITGRDPEGLEIIRHSTAHLLAQAVKRLFPTAQVTIGPVIEDGFYYDFSYPERFSPEDIDRIAAEMRRIVKDHAPVTREIMQREQAVQYFRQEGEHYKAEILAAIPEGDDISLLQRIYGTAWADKKDLNAYLHRIEEAEKRDHRKLGKQLDLFHFQEEAPGMVFWHDHGWRLYTVIQDYMRGRLRAAGYQEVNTPEVVDIALWQKSGHADKFIEDMFITESENRTYAVKPMNCPCHVQIYNQGLHSYRDLPLRLAEFGACHRNEPSGALHGLMRVRAFTQDDAHIFCTEDQVQDESARFIDLLYSIYRDFGFEEIFVKLSTRPDNRIGEDEQWETAEKTLAAALDEAGIDWEENPGEGAFYGPKIEFSLKDTIGRVWQCGTLQMDFFMPVRLNASYIADDNSRQVPVMLHRAILGSLERFIGILIENHGGIFPAWLAPVQAVVLNITENQAQYCKNVSESLENKGFRVDLDLRNEKIGFKIRQHTLAKVPYLLVVGDREVENGTVAVRSRAGEDLGTMSVSDFADHLAEEIRRRGQNEPEIL